MSEADGKRIDAIRQRANEAAPGPWEADGCEVYARYREWVAESLDTENIEQGEANAQFIANAREDVAWLISRLVELESK